MYRRLNYFFYLKENEPRIKDIDNFLSYYLFSESSEPNEKMQIRQRTCEILLNFSNLLKNDEYSALILKFSKNKLLDLFLSQKKHSDQDSENVKIQNVLKDEKNLLTLLKKAEKNGLESRDAKPLRGIITHAKSLIYICPEIPDPFSNNSDI